MTRYFFNIVDGMFLADNVGEEFDTLEQAQLSAIARAKSFIDQNATDFWRHDGVRVVVTDASGATVFDLSVVGRVFAARNIHLAQR